MCFELTSRHALTTIHWSAHDKTTTFQSGAFFHWRRKTADGIVDRRVQAARTDKKWDFFEHGDPLPEEDVEGYRARRKRDRLNEHRMIDLLNRLGADPWSEAFYDLSGQQVFALSRPKPKPAIKRQPIEVVGPYQ